MTSICLSQEEVNSFMSTGRLVFVRPVKPQPPENCQVGFSFFTGRGEYEVRDAQGGFSIGKVPFGWVGDRLALKETWTKNLNWLGVAYYNYKATSHPGAGFTWRSPVVMPQWAVRNFGIIESVTVKRVQEWTEQDVYDYGIYKKMYSQDGKTFTLVNRFADIWNSRYGNYDANPWCWIVGIRKVE